MDEVKKKEKPKRPVVIQDRVTLTSASSDKLLKMIEQLNDKFKDLIEINKSDLVNYFLDKQPEILSRDHIEKLRAAFYDEVKFLSWALQKVKESKKLGTPLSLDDLMHLSPRKTENAVKRTRQHKGNELSAESKQNESNEPDKSNIVDPEKPYLA